MPERGAGVIEQNDRRDVKGQTAPKGCETKKTAVDCIGSFDYR